MHRLGIYCGSFNPFHKGHLNVLQKAKRLFDSVIVARGINPDKDVVDKPPALTIPDHGSIEDYSGLTTDLITRYINQGFNVTLIRGLRNGNDLSYEMNQLRIMQDYLPDIQIAMIPCDVQFEHISSTAIRNLKKFNADTTFYT